MHAHVPAGFKGSADGNLVMTEQSLWRLLASTLLKLLPKCAGNVVFADTSCLEQNKNT